MGRAVFWNGVWWYFFGVSNFHTYNDGDTSSPCYWFETVGGKCSRKATDDVELPNLFRKSQNQRLQLLEWSLLHAKQRIHSFYPHLLEWLDNLPRNDSDFPFVVQTMHNHPYLAIPVQTKLLPRNQQRVCCTLRYVLDLLQNKQRNPSINEQSLQMDPCRQCWSQLGH